jgi:hypothetical protein
VIWTPSLFLDARASQWLRQKDGPAQDWTRGEGKRRQTPWDLVPAGFFRGSFFLFLFLFLFYFLHTLCTSRSRAQDSSHF